MRIALLLILIVLWADAGAEVSLADRRESLRAAFQAADSGQLAVAQADRFADHPLYPWLQASILAKQIDTIEPSSIQPVLDRLSDQPAGRWLRSAWLASRVKRRDWPSFRVAYRGSEDKTLRCADLAARLDDKRSDAGWIADAQALWLTGAPLSDICDGPFAKLAELGKLDEGLRWQRIDLAAAAGQTDLIRFLAKDLAPDDRLLAQSYAAFIDAPSETELAWPSTARSRNVAATALAGLARTNPARASALLDTLMPVLKLDQAQQNRVLYEVALWSAASFLPDAATRLEAVPASAYDERLHEWRAREAISRGDDAAALSAIGKMGAAQRQDSRWRYFEARLRERLGQAEAARTLYRQVAASATFHGWLAADRLHQPYALCALEPAADQARKGRVAATPGLVRAFELLAIDRPEWATREWNEAIRTMSDPDRLVAVELANQAGWYDRGVFALANTPEDLRRYSLRFPMPYETDIRLQAKANGLDPAWVAAQTRAESAFMPKARSAADARGLMQLQPSTGALMARRLGLDWQGGGSLYDPATNLRLGTAYLRLMLDRFGGFAYLAIAAYNSGPSPVERWSRARRQLEPDFFIESIPYKETREYVARVLAFSVVYDWRMSGNAAPLSERLIGRYVDDPQQRRLFACPTDKTATP